MERLEERIALTTIFTEDFEGAFPGSAWTVVSSQGRKWDDTDDRFHNGAWSGYCADLTSDADQTSYVDNMVSTMTRTVDLTDYRNASLSFWRYLNTESTYDGLKVTISKGSDAVTTTLLSGDHRSWIQDTVDVPSSLWGQSGVTVKFAFTSDSSNVPSAPSGVWLDDIQMTGIFDPGFPPETVAAPTGTLLRLNQFGDISGFAGSISSASNLDIYAFGTDVTGNYTISAGGAVDTQLRVYNSNGDAITGIIDNTNGTESTTVSLSGGTTCYFVVSGYISATGNYTVGVNGPSTTASSVGLSPYEFLGNGSDQINFPGDLDYRSIVAPAGTNSLTLTVSPSAGLNVHVTLLDTSGTVLTTRDAAGTGAAETISGFSTTPGQTYVVMISGASILEGKDSSESYSFTVNFDPDDFGDPPDVLPNLGSYTYALTTDLFGILEDGPGMSESPPEIEFPNSLDVYPYVAQVTGQHTFTVDGSADGLDTQLRVYDQSGNDISGGIIDSSGASGSETYSATLTKGQLYFFAVAGYLNDTGEYSFILESPIQPATTIDTTGIERTANLNASVDFGGELDFYIINVPLEATSMKLAVDPVAGLNTNPGLFDEFGNFLGLLDDGDEGQTDHMTQAVSAGQTYWLGVQAVDRFQTGAYTVQVDFDPNLTGPKVTKLEVVKDTKGKKVVGIILTFDKELAPGTALSILGNYELKLTKGSNQVAVTIASAVYNNKRVTLTPIKPIVVKKLASYTLRVRGDGSLTDLPGAHLDGNADGVPGGDFTRLLSQAE